MERPKKISERDFAVTVTGILDLAGVQLPRRRTLPICQWDFANGGAYDGSGHCPYQQTTLANGAGASSTALTVDDGTNLVDGRDIIIGSGAAVEISSGGGTTSITLADARTWADNDPVKYADCNREFSDCEKRELHDIRFGGFPAVLNVGRARWRQSGFGKGGLPSAGIEGVEA